MRQALRIGFAGASGTGKSALSLALAERYGIPINPVGSRSVSQAMGFASPYDVDKAGRRAEFQRRLLQEKMAWEREHDAFVSDRATLDNLAYTALHDVAAVDEECLRLTLAGLDRYTHVFFCPIAAFQHVGDDPARVKEAAYHSVYEALLLGLLIKYQNVAIAGRRPFYSLDESDLKARIDRAVAWIEYGGTF